MEFPATDCYENQKQMNIIAQAILLDHEFVNTCRKVGYTNIVAHTNDLVVQGQFLIYFSTAGTVSDTYEFVYEKMKNILEIGYHITDRALVEVLYTLGTRRGDVILRVSSTLIKCSEVELSKRFMFSGISYWNNFELFCTIDGSNIPKGFTTDDVDIILNTYKDSFNPIELRKKWKNILSSFDGGSFFWRNHELHT
ncbi:hypothetical protein C2G38_2213213 [Gigaspora rosea]|uniref:Uncharacterized protein n=1 Tax=Gigaspora rosea TaxID=44941 RepID=A0A397UFA9_9GLOM|nr:hypothetical protein C2G38_2213213 [Gigaspora rosea]